MKKFYFYFTIFYIIIYICGIDYIAHMSLFVALFMGFGAFALCVLCSTFMNEGLFKEFTGWNWLKKWANSQLLTLNSNKMKQFKKSREPTSFKTNVRILP